MFIRVARMSFVILHLVVVGVTVLKQYTASPIINAENKEANIIIEGKDAKRHQFPYQVSLQEKELFGDFRHYCGGSIITPFFVITAGHCIDDGDYDNDSKELRVVAGLLKMDKASTRDVQIAKVIKKFVHPDYNSHSDTHVAPNDIALVKVDKPFRYTKAVQPILLPEPGEESKGVVQLAGWGAISDSRYFPEYPNRLQHVSLPLLSFEECQQALNLTLEKSSNENDQTIPFLSRTMICTGSFMDHVSGCFGDSGGAIQQSNRLIGITSWVVLPCGKLGAPTMFTKVSYYVYFIKQIVDNL